MKKTIIIILAALPIVLLMVIAIAGKILALYQHIPVERVEFVDRIGTAYTEDISFTVPQDGTKPTSIRIYPELASNKKVTYTSSDEKICTVDEEGVITGVHFGTATVTVKTKDNSRIATLNVVVTADVPYKVTLSKTEKDMYPGGLYNLIETVDAPVSIDKTVTWSSSDESIATVDSLGQVTAHAPGEAFITVTTKSGGKTASCKITVLDTEPPFTLDLEDKDGIVRMGGGYIIRLPELDIKNYIAFAEGYGVEDLTVLAGDDKAEGGVIALEDGIINVAVIVGNDDDPIIHEIVIKIRFDT